MVINNNISAVNALHKINQNGINLSSSMKKLSSGMRINSAADDAAGLAVSEKMRAQIRGTAQASRNVQDGISLIQTADGWLSSIHESIHRLRELAIQSANGVYTTEDRQQIMVEVQAITSEVDKITSDAEFNTVKLLRGALRRMPADENYNKVVDTNNPYDAEKYALAGSKNIRPLQDPAPVEDPKLNTPIRGGDNAPAGEGNAAANTGQSEQGGLFLHAGANMDQRIQIHIENVSPYALGLVSGTEENGRYNMLLDYSSQDGSNEAIGKLDTALFMVTRERTSLGAVQNRLNTTYNGLSASKENLQASESRIRDANMAEEMISFTKNNILSQSSAAMLSHANVQPQTVLRLISWA